MSLMVAATVWMPAAVWAATRQGNDLQPDESIEVIEFTIRIGTEGTALSEPVALDLGLGFPFWLSPLGRGDEQLPIGAQPQTAPTKTTLEPGESATFIFRRDGEPGSDRLHTTSQLLQDVRLTDVARVGIQSRCSENWELGAYELKINGRLLVANEAVKQKAADSLSRIEQAWSEIRGELDSLQIRSNELETLVSSGLATETEESELAELTEKIRPLAAKLDDLENVLRGASPWFVENDLEIPGRTEAASLSQVKVTLVTAPHTNSRSYNHVYVRLGGRKYFLYPPKNLFSADAGPQVFELDLAQGPISAGDLRSVGVGMLAHSLPYAEAPDRWHPQRLIVELDGQTTYDSENEPVDKLSLEAIRLIPPAHMVDADRLQVNQATEKEVFVWLSGQAQGIDLLANPDTPQSPAPTQPLPEPDTTFVGSGVDQTSPGDQSSDGSGDPYLPGEAAVPGEPLADYNPADPSGPFSSEYPEGPLPYDSGAYDSGAGQDPFDSGLLEPPFSDDGDTPLSDYDFLTLLDWVSQIIEALSIPQDPTNVGAVPQIESVNVVRDDVQQYRVVWSLNADGDESLVDSFNVQLYRFDPSTGTVGDLLHAEPGVAPQQRSFRVDLSGVDDSLDKTFWVLPFVAAVVDPSGVATVNGLKGPAVPWLTAFATSQNQPKLYGRFHGAPVIIPPLEFSVDAYKTTPTGPLMASVWDQQIVSIADYQLVSAGYTSNAMVAKSFFEPFEIGLRYSVPDFANLPPNGRYKFIGHVGAVVPFPGPIVTMNLSYQNTMGKFKQIDIDTMLLPRPFSTQEFTGAELSDLVLVQGKPRAISISFPAGAPSMPVGIFGLRLVPVGP
jgi:hypothetical protein